MKYRFYFFICIFLLSCLLFGCAPQEKPNSSANPPSDELSIVEIYDILKDCDYWNYSYDGSFKAFKGEEEISLQGEKRICDVKFIDGWLYYVKAYDDYRGGFDICRVRPNGEDSSVFFNSAEFEDTENTFASFNSFVFVDGYMYIQASLFLYQYDMLTKTVKQIGDVSTYHIMDNQLYFIGHASKDFTIYVMDLQTEETKIVLGDGVYGRDKEYPAWRYSNFIFIGDIMYYTRRSDSSDSEFYLVELFRYENGESTLIDDIDHVREYSLFEHEGKLYYFAKAGDAVKLMQYNPIDEKVTEILTCNDFRSGPKIKDGYFYYQDSEDKIKRIKIP